jgi:hypothetical protein
LNRPVQRRLCFAGNMGLFFSSGLTNSSVYFFDMGRCLGVRARRVKLSDAGLAGYGKPPARPPAAGTRTRRS